MQRKEKVFVVSKKQHEEGKTFQLFPLFLSEMYNIGNIYILHVHVVINYYKEFLMEIISNYNVLLAKLINLSLL